MAQNVAFYFASCKYSGLSLWHYSKLCKNSYVLLIYLKKKKNSTILLIELLKDKSVETAFGCTEMHCTTALQCSNFKFAFIGFVAQVESA